MIFEDQILGTVVDQLSLFSNDAAYHAVDDLIGRAEVPALCIGPNPGTKDIESECQGPSGSKLPQLPASDTYDGLLDQLLADAKLAPTFAERALAAYFVDVRRGGGSLPRCGQSYCEKTILAQAGISWEGFVFTAGVRVMLAKYGALLPLWDHQNDNRILDKSGKTLVATVRRALDEMEERQIPLKRLHANRGHVSLQWLADYIGMPRALLRGNAPLQVEIRARLKAGRLKLGTVFVDTSKLTKARRRALRAILDPVLRRYLAERRPIASHPERADKIWFDKLFDEAGIADPHERDMMAFDHRFRVRLTEVLDTVGLAPEAAELARGKAVLYASLRDPKGDGVALVRQKYRAGHPDKEAGSFEENRYVENELSYLSRFLKENERSDEDEVADDFEKDFEACCGNGMTKSAGGNRNFLRSMDRWRQIAASLAVTGEFPPSFGGALQVGMELINLGAGTLAADTGAPRKLIYAWRRGQTVPNTGNEHFVPLIESRLGMPPGTLVGRLPAVAANGGNKGRSHLEISDGRKIRLSRLWRYLPAGAAALSDEVLRPMVESVLERHFRVATEASVRLGAGQTNFWRLPNEDPHCRIWSEWKDLVRFRQGLGGGDRSQLAQYGWDSDNSCKANRQIVSYFSRWCMLSRDEGGLGLSPREVSLRLTLNHKVITKYVTWRILRCRDLELDGKPLELKVSSTEKGIVGFFSALVEPEYGWLTQSKAQLGISDAIPTAFRLPEMKITKKTVEVLDEAFWTDELVFSRELRVRCEENYEGVCREARKHLRGFRSKLSLSFKMVRNPKDLIGPILNHITPLGVTLRMVKMALQHVRPLETSPWHHAKDYERILAMLLLLLVVFRSGTARNLTWRADNTGNIRWVDGSWQMGLKGERDWMESHYEVIVEADEFKNLMSKWLFGPSWDRRPYERALKDWGGFNGILQHYVEVCRPILLRNRKTDLLFPPPDRMNPGNKEWSEASFNYLISSFTRMWCVYNERTGTGMPGVRAFGPHPVRNIMATHILLYHPSEDRWELAARLLNTGIEQIKLRYGWVDTRRELAKLDGIFDGASAQAESDTPLW